MAIRVLFNGVEIRKPGYTVAAGVNILAGNPVNLDASDTTGATIIKADGTTTIMGFALETNVAPTSLYVDYDDYHRGGLISIVTGKGGEVEVWDDGRGVVYDTDQTYTINQSLYVGATGLITNQSNGSVIGIVTEVPTSATDALKFQLV